MGGGPEDFWGATKFFSEILGGHQFFFRNFGGLPNYFPKFWGATKFFLSIYQKKIQILFYVYKSTHACYLMSLDVNFTIPFPVFPRPFPVFLNYASPNSHPKYTPLEVLIQYDLRCQMTTRLRLTVFVNIISVFFSQLSCHQCIFRPSRFSAVTTMTDM